MIRLEKLHPELFPAEQSVPGPISVLFEEEDRTADGRFSESFGFVSCIHPVRRFYRIAKAIMRVRN